MGVKEEIMEAQAFVLLYATGYIFYPRVGMKEKNFFFLKSSTLLGYRVVVSEDGKKSNVC